MKRILLVVCGLALVAVSCGEEPQVFYTAETESNFLASCVNSDMPEPLPLDAEPAVQLERREQENLRQLQNSICQCTIDSLEQKVPYRTFAEYDAELRADLSQPLQAATRNELIDCIKQEGAL